MLESMFENAINNALDYYRGSNNTYEDAVKNRLNTLEATGVATTLAVSNMNSDVTEAINSTTSEIQGLRSDVQVAAVGLYNQGQGIRNDIQAMSVGVTSAIQESTYSIVASQEMLAKTFQHGFNAVNNTLDLGFNLVGKKIDVLSDNICSKIDQIQDILNNPRLTQSRELYRQALISYKKGFFEEALKDCTEAVEKNTTDFISWYLLGLIYIFGAGENGNVINLDKAEEAFVNAAKYIKPDIAKSKETKLLASEIFYHLGYTQLVKSNDYLVENRLENSTTKLIEAEKASATAYQLSKDNLLAGYEQAKELHFLEKNDESLKLLEELVRAEKNFALKAINDKNFESLWDRIEAIIEKLRKECIQLIKDSFEQVISASLSILEKNIELCTVMVEDDKYLNNDRKKKLLKELENIKGKNLQGFNRKKKEIQLKYIGIEDKDYFSVLATSEIEYKDLEEIHEHVKTVMTLTEALTATGIEVERKAQLEEHRKQKDEEHRKQKEEERRKQEEERRQQETAQRIQRLEQEKRELKNRRFRMFVIIILSLFLVWTIPIFLKSEYHQTNMLFKAIKRNDISKVVSCIKNGANINKKKGNHEKTPLMYAVSVKKRNPHMVEFLINSGAEINAQDAGENQAIHHLLFTREKSNSNYKKRAEILKILIRLGANINDYNGAGLAPLGLTTNGTVPYNWLNSNIECSKILIEAGANKLVKGSTYQRLETYPQYQEIYNLLKSYGATE